MIPTCHPGLSLLAQASEFRVPEFLLRWLDDPSVQSYLPFVAAGFGGLILGWLFGRAGKRKPAPAPEISETEPGDELWWRHEKLVLLERQDAEKQQRIVKTVEDLSHASELASAEVKARLFRIVETLRDIRQRVGTDLSRMLEVKKQLSRETPENANSGARHACLEIAESHSRRLEEVRTQLRPACSELIALEESFPTGLLLSESEKEKFSEALIEAKKKLIDLPGDWRTLTDEADRKIGELLAVEDSPRYRAIQEILLVDGAVTESLGHQSDAPVRKDIDAILEVLKKEEPSPVENEPSGKSFPIDTGEKSLAPDNGFLTPSETNGNGARSLEPDKGEDTSALDDPDGTSELLLFRANDVNLWGQTVYRGGNARARRISSLPDWANWVSIRRVDTDEAVYAPVTSLSFSNRDLEASCGFNASNELFYGARHLGMYSDAVPNEVETRFTYGGWGFGHRVSEADSDPNDLQASGWEGREIDPDTVFEIKLLESLPELLHGEKVLDPEVAVIPR